MIKKLILSLAITGFGFVSYAQRKMPPKKDVDRQSKIEEKRAKRMTEMQKDLNLTPQQVSQIEAVQDKRAILREQKRQQMLEQRKSKMAMRKKDSAQTDKEMREILTPEQYQKWEASKEDKFRSRHNKMMRDRERLRPGMHKKHPQPAQPMQK